MTQRLDKEDLSHGTVFKLMSFSGQVQSDKENEQNNKNQALLSPPHDNASWRLI